MIRTLVVLIAVAAFFAGGGHASAQQYDSRDILGGGPNFFGTGASPIPRQTVLYPTNLAPGTVVVDTAERRLYLGSTLYRIHGSNEPETIGQAVSSGCFRMTNEDVTDLYNRVSVGTTVVVKN